MSWRSPRRTSARPSMRRSTNRSSLLPQILAGDMQAAMNKLHTEEPKKAPEKKEPPKEVPAQKEPPKPAPEKTGLLKSLFGKK